MYELHYSSTRRHKNLSVAVWNFVWEHLRDVVSTQVEQELTDLVDLPPPDNRAYSERSTL